jgi:hypothetical protein
MPSKKRQLTFNGLNSITLQETELLISTYVPNYVALHIRQQSSYSTELSGTDLYQQLDILQPTKSY